jgi:hypothetical protein
VEHNVRWDGTGHFSSATCGQVRVLCCLYHDPVPARSAQINTRPLRLVSSVSVRLTPPHVLNKTERERVRWSSCKGQTSALIYIVGAAPTRKVARMEVVKCGTAPRTSHAKHYNNNCLSECRSSEGLRINIGCVIVHEPSTYSFWDSLLIISIIIRKLLHTRMT